MRRSLRTIMGSAFLTLALAGTALAGPLEDAAALIKSGKAAAALNLLEPLEGDRAGEPGFDYLFGLAALNAGRADLAVFAFERAVAMEPNNAQYRAELARAFFELREDEAAKAEFENANKLEVPADVQATIRSYLEAIDTRFASEQSFQWTMFAETGAGYDSNVNAATDQSTVAIPALGNNNFVLSANSVSQNDTFLTGKVGARLAYRLTKSLTAFAGLSANRRLNMDEDFDTTAADVNGALRYQAGRNVWTAGVIGQQYAVDNDLFRTVKGVTANWQYTIDGRNQVSVFGQLGALEYHPDANALRDATMRLGGVGWSHAFTGEGSPTMYVSVYGAEDDERSTFPHLGRKYFGIRAGGSYKLREDLNLFVSASWQKSNYGGTEPLFLKARDDDFYEIGGGVRYQPMKGWSVTPQLRFSKNKSNIPLNDYDRVSAWAVVRYDYR